MTPRPAGRRPGWPAHFSTCLPISSCPTLQTFRWDGRVKSGDTAVMISNNTTMLVDITVDDRNISFINQGMTVELTDYNQNVFMGTVTSINMGGAESKNGMTTYPVTLEVDNSAGTLYDGAWLDYSFVTSEADNVVVPPGDHHQRRHKAPIPWIPSRHRSRLIGFSAVPRDTVFPA